MIDNNKGDYAVLFVDDEEKALKYFEKAIGSRIPVLTAGDVDSAIEILQERNDQIAIVVSDQRMPGKNGVELLKFVRQHYPSMVRLLTTAYSDLNDAIDAINRGEIYRYIQKPWHVDSLQAEVAGAMHYFLLRRERDLLLAEKLSTRQRMTDVQRLGQLIVYGQMLQSLPNADYGLRNFLELLHTLPGARESDNLNSVDQWELTRWESKRSSDFLNALQPRLSAEDLDEEQSLSVDELEAALHQAAGNSELELSLRKENMDSFSSKEQPWKGQRTYLTMLFREVCALLALLRTDKQVPSCTLSPALETESSEVLAVTFTLAQASWPDDRHLLSGSVMTGVNPVFQHLFAASLLAAAVGGRHHLAFDEQALTVRLVLPTSGEPLPELGWDWQVDVLPEFEPAIEEFYPEL